MHKPFKRWIAGALLGFFGLAKQGLADQRIYCIYAVNGYQAVVSSELFVKGEWLKVDKAVKTVSDALFDSQADTFRVDRTTAHKIVQECRTLTQKVDVRARFLQARTPFYKPGLLLAYLPDLVLPSEGYPVSFEYKRALARVGSTVLQHYLETLTFGSDAVMVVRTGATEQTHGERYYRVDDALSRDPDFLFDITSPNLPQDHKGQFDVVVFQNVPYGLWTSEQIDRALKNAMQVLKPGGRLVSNMPATRLFLESEVVQPGRGRLQTRFGKNDLKFSPASPAVAFVSDHYKDRLRDARLLREVFDVAVGQTLGKLGMKIGIATERDRHWKNTESVRGKEYFTATKPEPL